jgi:hypothetical protein
MVESSNRDAWGHQAHRRLEAKERSNGRIVVTAALGELAQRTACPFGQAAALLSPSIGITICTGDVPEELRASGKLAVAVGSIPARNIVAL